MTAIKQMSKGDMKNVVFFFTGTGNSYEAARRIAASLPKCELLPMVGHMGYRITSEHDRVGFVYPTYFGSIPLAVERFIAKLIVEKDVSAYMFGVATYASLAANAVADLAGALARRGESLSWATTLKMASNWIVGQGASPVGEKTNADAYLALERHAKSILERENGPIPKPSGLMERYSALQKKHLPTYSSQFVVNKDRCISCGLCAQVCPTGNISYREDGTPGFSAKCEACMACIQYCPRRAINFKRKTTKRMRYVNRLVPASVLIEANRRKA